MSDKKHPCGFVKIGKVEKYPKPENSDVGSAMHSIRGRVVGAIVGCPTCGEIRIIWQDGTIEVGAEGYQIL